MEAARDGLYDSVNHGVVRVVADEVVVPSFARAERMGAKRQQTSFNVSGRCQSESIGDK